MCHQIKNIKMKKLFSLLILIAGINIAYSQNYDLIVKSTGDSIACRIDSITDSQIYFEMKVQNHWIKTNIDRNEVIEYERNVIDMKSFVFKPGTSVIQSPKKNPASIREVQKNSVYIGILTFNYSRMFPGEGVGFTLSGGMSIFPEAFDEFDLEDGFSVLLLAEGTILFGHTKHFFEPGILAIYDVEEHFTALTIRTCYRYQAIEGFLFRAGLLFGFMDGITVLPALSLGYSF